MQDNAAEDCKQKRAKPNNEKDKEEDLINQLPNGIPGAILSKLPIEEATRTSILSSKWRYLWTFFSGTLVFEGSPTMKTIKKDLKATSGWHLQAAMIKMLDFERQTYISWMNELLNSLKSPTIQGLRIWFDVGAWYAVDKWVEFAMEKKVENLELYFGNSYFFPLHLFTLNVNSLRVLCLKHINVRGDLFEDLLSCSPFLETLSLANSVVPKSIKVSGSSLKLRRLELVRCWQLSNLEIFAENLVSFKYYGSYVDTKFKSVPRLVEATFGGSYVEFIRESFLSQIKVLKLDVTKNAPQVICSLVQLPQLKNLKHLELVAFVDDILTLNACVFLLKASPSLFKFTLKMLNAMPIFRTERKFTKEYQYSLKELELVGFCGAACEVEVAMHVVANAAELQKITIDPRLPTHPKMPPQDRLQTWDDEVNRKRGWELQDKMPSSVEFVCL